MCCVQEIKVSQDFLKVLNGQLAHMVSLLLFVFIGLWIEGMLNHMWSIFLSTNILFLGMRALYELKSEYRFTVIVTSLNVIQWSILIAIPIVQVIMLQIILCTHYGKHGELLVNHQIFLPQMYKIFNILLGHLPSFSTPNNLNISIC